MFEEIAKEMVVITNTHVTPSNCENRWKVLVRNYKKYIDNINKTGRGRKVFEYYDIMQNILVPCTDKVYTKTEDSVEEVMEAGPSISSLRDFMEQPIVQTPSTSSIRKTIISVATPKKMKYRRKKKFSILKEIRNDRKEYYAKRLDIEERKLQQKVKKNELLEQKNKLLEKLATQRDSIMAADPLLLE